MLHEFLREHRHLLIARARALISARRVPRATDEELGNGVPLFLTQLTEVLRAETARRPRDDRRDEATEERVATLEAAMGASAVGHGTDLLRRGFTVAQVVHDYGDLCQAITGLAVELGTPIDADEYKTLNRCLDDVTAAAVGEYARVRERSLSSEGTERMGVLAHELRNLLSTAMLAYESVRSGRVGVDGSTSAVLGRSLRGLKDVIDRSLAEVRLGSGPPIRERTPVAEFVEEIEIGAALDAKARGVALTLITAYGVAIDVDRQLLGSAVSNLLQNAFKFTPRGGQVTLTTRAENGRVLIEIADECGGLAPGVAESLFRPFERRGTDRTGLGLGLTISQRCVEANGGTLGVRSVPGKGCVFTIDLPTA